jgi:hypothetical protein
MCDTHNFGPSLETSADVLAILLKWRDELEWRLAKAPLQLVWMEKREFDALVTEVQSWKAACEIFALAHQASNPKTP